VKVAHPQGIIRMNLTKNGKGIIGDIELPEGLKGNLYWGSDRIQLSQGKNDIRL